MFFKFHLPEEDGCQKSKVIDIYLIRILRIWYKMRRGVNYFKYSIVVKESKISKISGWELLKILRKRIRRNEGIKRIQVNQLKLYPVNINYIN